VKIRRAAAGSYRGRGGRHRRAAKTAAAENGGGELSLAACRAIRALPIANDIASGKTIALASC